MKGITRESTIGKVEKKPSILISPVIPPGEDEHSFSRHNLRIKAELRKSSPNMHVLDDLASRSFAFRRKDILSNTWDITTIFTKYPLLEHSPEQVIIIIFGNYINSSCNSYI